MIECVRVPLKLPNDREPSKPMIRDLVGTFLKEWATINPEDLIVRYETDTSAHCFVERPKHLSPQGGSDPTKVFIKFHMEEGVGVEAFKDLVPSKKEEAALVRHFSATGYGPKMIGFFDTDDGVQGRVDELINSRTLEPEDVETDDIRADIANAYAALHALKIPELRQNSVNMYYQAVLGGLRKYHKMEKLKRLGKEGGVDIDDVVDYDFASKIERILDYMRSIGAKEGWCMHDVQYGNVLVRNKPDKGESKIALIDFEFAFRNYRGFDIGGHWFQKMFKWTGETNKIVDCRPYSEGEKRHFCDIYARKWNEITGDNDTAEQVFTEATLGYMLALSFDIHFMSMAMDDDDSKDPLDSLGLKKLLDEFEKGYLKFVSERVG
ncbi:choline/ethanolamine kinase [Fusarium austroafricanum]|uniref:Choline/ethanolamine kinase n=1 Tax=Fusarium austroafricanum TaxID=2364996 RepID=A0A8H4P0E6_9HYPO|nr:choline/ethanolamine kinase [Fusarium austroafricanum]